MIDNPFLVDPVYGQCPKCGGNLASCATHGCPNDDKINYIGPDLSNIPKSLEIFHLETVCELLKENQILKTELGELKGIRDQFNWQSEQDAQALKERDEEIKKLYSKIEQSKLYKALLERLFKWVGKPWDTPEGFAAGCKFCGKPYPDNFREDVHYSNCMYEKIKKVLGI